MQNLEIDKKYFYFFTAIESLEHFDCFQMVEFFLIRRFYDLEGLTKSLKMEKSSLVW